MAKKKPKKQTEEELREEVKDFLIGINVEGMAYYFTGYSSPERLVGLSYIPESFLMAARAMAASHKTLEEEIKKLHKAHGIDEQETEY